VTVTCRINILKFVIHLESTVERCSVEIQSRLLRACHSYKKNMYVRVKKTQKTFYSIVKTQKNNNKHFPALDEVAMY